MAQCRRESIVCSIICIKAELLVESRHYGVHELPQLAGGQLGALGDIVGIEGEQVVGGDEGLVERGQQM